MSFVRQFAMERFLPESPDFGQGLRTALMGEAQLYEGDVLGAANPMHAYNAKRALAEYGMQAATQESKVPKKQDPFNQALGTAASVFGLARPFMGGGGNVSPYGDWGATGTYSGIDYTPKWTAPSGYY